MRGNLKLNLKQVFKPKFKSNFVSIESGPRTGGEDNDWLPGVAQREREGEWTDGFKEEKNELAA